MYAFFPSSVRQGKNGNNELILKVKRKCEALKGSRINIEEIWYNSNSEKSLVVIEWMQLFDSENDITQQRINNVTQKRIYELPMFLLIPSTNHSHNFSVFFTFNFVYYFFRSQHYNFMFSLKRWKLLSLTLIIYI